VTTGGITPSGPIVVASLWSAPTLLVLVLGWSIIERLGAALVLPALAALVGGNDTGKDGAIAYAVIGGLSGAGIAIGRCWAAG
jgi:hypothetical protein